MCNFRLPMPALVLLLAFLPCSNAAFAHGATYEAIDADASAMRFVYLLGDAMGDAEVRVYGPDSHRIHQRARTDLAGRFAFVPDRPGEWRVEADDSAGHSVRAHVTVGTGGGSVLAAPDAVAIAPRLLVALLVASLLVNAGLCSVLLARRQKTH